MPIIDCKQRAVDTALSSQLMHDEVFRKDTGYRPSGVRTPIQLSRTC
jgi:hypothetical protein